MSNPATNFLQDSVWEGTDATLMARIQGGDGENITQASVSSIELKVFDINNDNAQKTPTLTPAAADVIFDTLQTDNRWTKDAVGYNFRYTLDGSVYLDDGGNDYRIQIKFTPASGGGPLVVVYHLTAENLFGE